MIKSFSVSQKIPSAKLCRLLAVGFVVAIALNFGVNASFAADPFRSSQPRKIGDKTEAAFKAVFQQGNYSQGERYLEQAVSSEPDEPLAYAMKASFAYTNQDWVKLDNYSKKTLEISQKMMASDPLRGNLYSAVGHFLGGAVAVVREGTVNGAPKALSRLRQVYQYLDKAETISASDPELNLIKGYMDLMLAVNLPFANPQQAIDKLEKNAARGIALAYRDLKQYSQGLEYANRALKATPNNPELYYLKAQILTEQAKKDKNLPMMKEAVSNFDKALSKKLQLPSVLVKQIENERRNANINLTGLK
jgi:tetratricopeptide (TPR) repeat protein